MKRTGFLVAFLFVQAAFISPSYAGDFGWMDSLNVTAKSDSSGFRVSLATRFHVGNTEVKAVIGDVSRPSDAYMVFRLSELSHRPVAEVMTVYRANRNKGWGVMAKGLGIKPGSSAFHALKRGHDLERGNGNERGQSPGKGKGNKNGNGNGKGKGKK
ncbi:MAG: hypothetical protein V3R49_06755 [Gammaproteobacteria bacterium]